MLNNTYSIFVVAPMYSSLDHDFMEAASDQFSYLAHPWNVRLFSFGIGYTKVKNDFVYLCTSVYNVVEIIPSLYPAPGTFIGTIILIDDSGRNVLLHQNAEKLHEYINGKHYPVAIIYTTSVNNSEPIGAESIRKNLNIAMETPIFVVENLSKDSSQEVLVQCYEFFRANQHYNPTSEIQRLLKSAEILSTNDLYTQGRHHIWILAVTTQSFSQPEVLTALYSKFCWHLRDDNKLLQWYGYRDVNESTRIYVTKVANFGHRDAIQETFTSLSAIAKGEQLPPPPRTYFQIAEYIKQKDIVGFVGTFVSQQPWHESSYIDDNEIIRVQNMMEEFGDTPFVLIDLNSESNIPEIRKQLKLADEIPLLVGMDEANKQQLYPLLEQEIRRKQNK